MSETETVQKSNITEGAYSGIFLLLNLKREALGMKPIKEADMEYTSAGVDIFLSADNPITRLQRKFDKSDLKAFVSPSGYTRTKAAIKMRGWKIRRFVDILMNPEDERISIDYK